MTPERRRRLLTLLLVLPLVVVLASAVALGWPWYRWATAGESPYDEIGIAVNGWVPPPMRRWACARIAERFPRTLPPYTCERTQ